MKKKVSTVMDASLFQRAKLEAARQGRPMSAVLEDALVRYFARPEQDARAHLSVADSWGAMALPSELNREIMEEDDDDEFYA
jgi:hypothetical protein